MSPEFNLIQQYFTRPTRHTRLGVGDDAALISLSAGMELAISADMLVAGTHFFADCDAEQLGWKSLAVNVSDMAAMGAAPKWATLAIALPEINHAWLAEFSRGFFACADAFNVDLIGGDTTRGPLTISVQIMGEVPSGQEIKRSGAKIGDDVWVSGKLGSAALGLAHLQGKVLLEGDVLQTSLAALHSPTPRAELSLALRGIATSCIDISDGLLADLGHILKASHVGATLNLATITCQDYLRKHIEEPIYQQYLLAGGDDYELCFTAPSHARDTIAAVGQQFNLTLSRIGYIHNDQGLKVLNDQQQQIQLTDKGYDHFAKP